MAGCETAGFVHPSPDPFPQGKGGSAALVSGEGDFFCDGLEHAVGVLDYVVVPEADYLVAVGFDAGGSSSVGLGRMLTTVAFDREAQAAAGEVDHVVPDRKLPGEFDPAKLTGAQMRPQAAFRISHVVAQLARYAGQSFFRQTCTPIPNPFPQGKGLRST